VIEALAKRVALRPPRVALGRGGELIQHADAAAERTHDPDATEARAVAGEEAEFEGVVPLWSRDLIAAVENDRRRA
jgi:hypothetical protein